MANRTRSIDGCGGSADGAASPEHSPNGTTCLAKVFEGRVTEISPIGAEKDNVTTFQVEVSIDNPGKELKANMSANAEIILEQFPDSLLVPEAAVTFDAQKNAFVDVVDPGAKTGRRRVSVKVGVGNGTRMQVLSGVKAGDKVVLPG